MSLIDTVKFLVEVRAFAIIFLKFETKFCQECIIRGKAGSGFLKIRTGSMNTLI